MSGRKLPSEGLGGEEGEGRQGEGKEKLARFGIAILHLHHPELLCGCAHEHL